MGNFLLWLVIIAFFASLLRLSIWLNAINTTRKDYSRMRTEIRIADAADLKAFGGGKVDLSELDASSAQLEKMGFRELGILLSSHSIDPIPTPRSSPIVDPVQEIASPSKIDTKSTGIARVFVHRDYGCYANLISIISIAKFDESLGLVDKIKIAPFRTAILSMENSDENAWRLANSNREVSAFSLLFRHPRGLLHRMVGAAPEELLKAHLIERDGIAQCGGFHWDKELSMEKYRAMENSTIDYIRSITKTWKTIPVAFHLLTYKFKNHDWWLGKLKGFPKQ